MAKKVFYDDDARRRVLAGAEILYNAVKTTMGPKGRNVIIDKSYGNPTVTHDGVTVAKGVEIEDKDDETLGYKVGAELIKQAANKMNDVAGDGTTTVTVLTYHILNEANKLIAAGHNPIQLRKGLEQASQDVLEALTKLSESVENNKQAITEVATISASGDAEIGKLIASVIKEVGKNSVVTVEEGQGLNLESEVVKGFTTDRGYISPYMATDTVRMEAVYENPAIVITDKKLSSFADFVPVVEKIAQSGVKSLLLIAEDVDGEALGSFIVNKLKGVFNTVAIKAPSFGDKRKEILNDIAVLTGAQVISEELGHKYEDVDLSWVGSAKKVIVDKDKTTIVDGKGSKLEVGERIANINVQAKGSKNDYEKKGLEERSASLQGKVAVIKVGGATETEIEEKKFRVDDAVAAVKASLEDGIVPGGGVTLVNLVNSIDLKTKELSSVLAGKQILANALVKPFTTIVTNSGHSADKWLEKVYESESGHGINVADDNPQIINLKEAGIIDPTRVTREVVQNAVSIAGTAITMGALVVEVPKEEAPVPNMQGMM